MVKKKTDTTEDIVAEEPQAPQPPKELTKREKAKLLNDLACACENEELNKVFQKMPNGDKIYEVFCNAIDREVDRIMSGKISEEMSKDLNNVAYALRNANEFLAFFENKIRWFHHAPFIETLTVLNSKLGATGAPPQMPNIAPVAQNQVRQERPQEPLNPGVGPQQAPAGAW